MTTNQFFGCTSPSEVQLRFDKLSKVYSDQDALIEILKAEYSTLMAVLTEPKTVDEEKEKVSIEDIIKLVQERFNPEGLRLELSGRWLWMTGTGTFAVREGLKQIGFRYSQNKRSWYWRDEADRSSNEKPIPFEMIREKFGSQQVALR